jgi:putative addiction module antidote
MLQVKVTSIGNSLGIVLPKEALSKLHAKKGDTVYLCDSPEGYTLTPYDQEFAKQMAVAEEVMHDKKDVLKVLAKS